MKKSPNRKPWVTQCRGDFWYQQWEGGSSNIVSYTVAKSIQVSPYKYILNDNGELNEVVYAEYRDDIDKYVYSESGDIMDKSTRCDIEYFPAQEP